MFATNGHGNSERGGAARVLKSCLYVLAGALALGALCGPAAAAKLEVLHEFAGPEGCDPMGGLTVDPNTGILYGTAAFCGGTGGGTLFSLTPPKPGKRKWKFDVLYDFQGGAEGSQPEAAPTLSFSPVTGALFEIFGTTHKGSDQGTFFVLTKSTADTWTHLVLHDFSCAEGAIPNSPLQFSPSDPHHTFLYSTTSSAGCGGLVYEVDILLGTLRVINNPDAHIGTFVGNHPQGLALDGNGTIFGTMFDGKSSGTVFRMDKNGKGKVLHEFDGPDGAYPQAPPILDQNGALWGTTWEGGHPKDCPNSPGCGVIWKKPPSSKQKVMHSFRFFAQNKDGQDSRSALALDEATGTLYGTTYYGGRGTGCGGLGGSCGTVFKIEDDGGYQVLWQFPKGGPANPQGQLVFHDGALYGTSYDGGQPCPAQHYLGCGTVWKLTP
jgi:hypothetical protein